MSVRHVFVYLKSTSRLIKRGGYLTLLAAVLAMVVGCSSALTKVETWQGNPPSAASAAVLKVPGEIQVEQVNGRSMTNYLLDDLALDYALLPGENEVVFTYKTIWAKSGVVKNGESKVYTVKSEPQVVHFTAEPEAIYKFSYQKPESRRDAEQMMPAFTAAVVTAGGASVAQSHTWVPEQAPARTPVSLTKTPVGVSEIEGADGNTLETLKSIWATASEEDKKTFLRWAFE
ncbi:MAG TPA: DUF2057 family protein [Marinobacter sp.]|nr:DUF2057 family protein [Marinobacter sp.]